MELEYSLTCSACATVVEGRNLPVMDPTGKSDPYCVVIVGNQEQRTVVQYSTVCPTWHETLQFKVSGVPQLMQNEPGNNNLSLVLCLSFGTLNNIE